jgi:hypothetical protein
MYPNPLEAIASGPTAPDAKNAEILDKYTNLTTEHRTGFSALLQCLRGSALKL